MLAWDEDRVSNSFWDGPKHASAICITYLCEEEISALVIIKANKWLALKMLKMLYVLQYQIIKIYSLGKNK